MPFASNVIAALPLSGTVTIPNRGTNQYDPPYLTYDLGGVRANETAFLGNFASTISILEDIAEKELVQQPLNQTEADFLKDVVEIHYLYSPTLRQYNGWYPNLFFRNVFQQYPFGRGEGSDQWDALVADVHTDPTDPILHDPGAVIHEAIGDVHLLLIAVDNGPDRMVYAGPVMSHYEFEMPGSTRLSDADWKTRLRSSSKPPSPEWTKSYLVPGLLAKPFGY